MNVTIGCGITNASYAVKEAYLVPKEERAWYMENEMYRYAVEVFPDITSKTNLLPLRSDIYHAFNSRWFVIVPKLVTTDSSIQPSFQYVTHIMVGEAAELWPQYHNAIVGSLHPAARELLFARFAWAIFFQVRMFVTDGRHRHVIRCDRTTDDNEYKTE